MQQKQFDLTFAGRTYRTFYLKDEEYAIDALRVLQGKARSPLGLDLETMPNKLFISDPLAALDPLRSIPRLIQISDGFNIIVLDLLYTSVFEQLKTFLNTQKFVAHNAIFEIQHLLHNFCVVNPDVGCTKIATRLLYDAIYHDSASYAADLGSVVKSLLNVDLPKDISHAHWAEPELTFEQVSYAALDAAATLLLSEKLSAGLQKYKLGRIYNLYKKAQVPLAKMQLNGILMNGEKHLQMIAKWKEDGYKAKQDLLKLTGIHDTNPKEMIAYLESSLPKEVLAIWPLTEGGEKETQGELSLSADTLSDFSYLPIVEPFSRFKKATKLSSTYGMKLFNRTNAVSKRIHCSYNLCGAMTGRLSCSNPNMQQLPRDDETRALFIAPKGRVFVVADFNQIELRVAAELSRDEEMLRAYKNLKDLHIVTAEMLSGRKIESMSPKEAKVARQSAKALNFGLLFGLGKKKFRHYAHKNYGAQMSEDEAYEAVTAWHELYAGYSAWHAEMAYTCKEILQVRTASGKLRALSKDNYYGACANTPVQGSASECLLSSLNRLNNSLDTSDRLINTVHDEINIETDDTPEDIARVTALMHSCMQDGFKDIFPNGIVTPKIVEVKSGYNWAQCK